MTGLPDRPGRKFAQADWLIRPSIDQLKSADALKPGR